jgi:hypothetical protein
MTQKQGHTISFLVDRKLGTHVQDVSSAEQKQIKNKVLRKISEQQEFIQSLMLSGSFVTLIATS